VTEIRHILHWLEIASFAGGELLDFQVCDNLYAEYHKKTAEKLVDENFDRGLKILAGKVLSAVSSYQQKLAKMLGMEVGNRVVGTLSFCNFLCLFWYSKELQIHLLVVQVRH